MIRPKPRDRPLCHCHFDHTRANTVDPNVLPSVFHSHRFGQQDDPPLETQQGVIFTFPSSPIVDELLMMIPPP
jgi:hypothetical protein